MKASVSAILLWLTLRHVALAEVAAQISTIDRTALFVALLVLLAATMVAALRWSIILSALGQPRGPGVTYPLSLIGLFFGQALPAGIGGDVVRVWLACKTGLTPRIAISSVLGDRLTGFFAILLIVTAELPRAYRVLPKVMFEGLAVMLFATYAAFVVVMLVDKLPASLLRVRLFGEPAKISADLRKTLLSPAGLLVLLCGAIVQLANVLAILALAKGFHIQQAGLQNCLLVVPLANIAQSVPVSVAGWGVREGFFVAAFGVVGVTPSEALAVSIVFGVLVIVSSLPGGVLWLLQGTGSPRKVREVSLP